MKNTKNNKGFSLVELIVVVLIMAIIAVALAPQVMKWVNNARITSDQNTAGVIKSACLSAVADAQAKGRTLAAETLTLNGAGTTADSDASSSVYEDLVQAALGADTYTTKYDDDGFTITITNKGAVTVTCGASTVTELE